MLIETVIVNDLIVENGGKDLLEKFEASSVWWGGLSTLVIIVSAEEVVETAVTVVRAVGDIFIISVGVTEVGETMVGNDVGKGGAVVPWEIVLILFCCETCIFWRTLF